MKTHSLLLTLALAGATTFSMAQMSPGGMSGQQQPSSGVPDASQSGPMSESPSAGANQTSTAKERASAKPMVDDQTLQKQVHDQLAADPALSNVQVNVEKGVVHLDGTVANKADRKKAKDIAKSVPGVTRIKDKITVSANGSAGTSASATSPSGTATSTSSVSPSSSSSTASSSPSSSSASSSPQSSSSYPSSSSTSPSSSAEQNPSGSSSTMGTSPSTSSSAAGTSGSMSGTATSNSSSSQAPSSSTSTPPQTSSSASSSQYPSTSTSSQSPSTAGSISGNTQAGSSSGQIGAAGSASSTPVNTAGMSNDQLKAQIENALHNEPTLANGNVAVTVTDSNIDLSGSVPTSNDKQTAERIAQSYAGNRQLSDHLSVGSSSGMSPQSGTTGMSGSSSSTGSTSTAPTATTPTNSPSAPSTTTPPSGSTPPQR